MFKRKDVAAAWIMLAIGSALLRFVRWGYPDQVTFDEVLIGHFLSHYFSGAHYFDIHPPHMKLWYALLLKCGGFNPGNLGFPKVESVYPGSYYLWARGFVAMCGVAVPLLASWIAMALGARRAWGFAIGAALAMDGALIVESRFMLNDMPMLCFGLAGWAAFLKWREVGGAKWLALGCLGLAAAGSVKWTGLAFSIPVGLALVWGMLSSNQKRLNAWALCALIGGTLAWHMAGYAIHFSLLDKSGPGNSYMSSAFNARFAGPADKAKGVQPLSLISAVGELHYKMVFYADKVGPHPYSSSWLSWPVGYRGIYVWNNRAAGTVIERIYMLPNLVLWWCVALAMARDGLAG